MLHNSASQWEWFSQDVLYTWSSGSGYARTRDQGSSVGVAYRPGLESELTTQCTNLVSESSMLVLLPADALDSTLTSLV